MFQRKPRRFSRRSYDRGRSPHIGGGVHARIRPNSFSNNQTRNNFRQSMSAEKLFEKYNSLAKEAMSSGDKTLAENYLQHADHFQRIIEDKNKNRNQNRFNVIERIEEEKNLSNANNVNSETSNTSKENNEDKNKV